MDYVIVIDIPAYRISERVFAIEGAFASHLRMLREKLSSHFTRLVLVAPTYDRKGYEADRGQLLELDAASDGIVLEPLYPFAAGHVSFWTWHLPRTMRTLWSTARRAGLVHTGLSHKLWRPVTFLSFVSAAIQRKPSIFVVDVDHRESARMFHATGIWSRKSYLLCRHVYDPLRNAQIRLASRSGALCLFKGQKLVEDFGGDRPNVHNFFDTAFSADNVVSPERLERKLDRLRDPSSPLRLVYFGRLIAHKGVDRAIRAVRLALDHGGRPLELHIVGEGAAKPSLEALVTELGVKRAVHFHDPLPFGTELFEALEQYDLSVATPLAEDTPRAAFDAFAAGLPVVAFDTTYFNDLSVSGAVVTSQWPSPSRLAERLVELDGARSRIEDMARNAVRFALQNTQEIWLDRRIAWTLEAFAP
jgi:glycosyltransferase involved in cell wall biosynthesis